MSKEQLQTLIDETFAFVEGKMAGHPLIVDALEVAREGIDKVGIDALLAFLASKGLV